MGLRYWVGGNDNWNATAGLKWSLTSGGVGGEPVPTNLDDVIKDDGSNITINAVVSCKSFNSSSANGAIILSAGELNVYGDITFGSGHTISGVNTYLIPRTTGVITSNNNIWTGPSIFAHLSSYTIADVLTINMNFGFTSNSVVINGGDVILNGGCVGSYNGTSEIIINSTGTITASISNNLTINSSANVTIINTSFGLSGNNLFQILAGATVNWGTSTLTVYGGTYNFGTNEPYNVLCGTGTKTLLADLTITNTLSNGASTTWNGFSINCKKNITAAAEFLGTTIIKCIGSDNGVWSGTGNISNNMSIEKDAFATCQLSGSLNKRNGYLNYISGIIKSDFSTLNITNSMSFNGWHKAALNNVVFNATGTYTFDEFFCGNPEIKTRVTRTNSTITPTIVFTTPTQKKAFFVNVNGITVQNRNQLNIIGNNPNGGNNTGVLFGDAGMEGFPLNIYTRQIGYGMSGFLPGTNY